MTAVTTYCLDARTATAHFPGVGRYAANLLRAMPPLLQDNERLVALLPPQKKDLYSLAQLRHPKVLPLSVDASPFSLKQQMLAPKILAEQQACVYHATYLLKPLFPRKPTLLTVYDLIPRILPEESSLKARWFFTLALQAALRTSNLVTCISETTRKDLEAFSPRAGRNAAAIPLAADPSMQSPRMDLVAETKDRLGLPRRYMLYVGSNKPHKNLPALLQACSRLERPIPLVIAGAMLPEYPLAEYLSRDAVIVLGPVADADLPALYSGAELFVFASLYEGFGLPVLEAMACGAAVACSRIPALQEVAGDAAVFFDPRDPEAMARVLSHALGDPSRLESLRSLSRERAAQFSWSKTASATLALYRKLADTA